MQLKNIAQSESVVHRQVLNACMHSAHVTRKVPHVKRLQAMRPQDLTSKSVIFGEPDDCIDHLRQLAGVGIREVILYCTFGLQEHAAVMDNMKCFAHEVLPHVTERSMVSADRLRKLLVILSADVKGYSHPHHSPEWGPGAGAFRRWHDRELITDSAVIVMGQGRDAPLQPIVNRRAGNPIPISAPS